MTSLKDISDGLADVVDEAGGSILRLRARRRPASAVVWKDGEHAVTVAHAVGRHDSGEVELPDGEVRAATVVARDPSHDLALLKIEGGGLPPARWEDVTPRAGSLVIVMARGPGGPRATLGMVSATGGAWRAATGADVTSFLEVDAVLPRSGAGGPLVSPGGAVLGVNTPALVRGGTTVPTATVERVVQQLLEGGDTKRGWLGVGVHPGRLGDDLAAAAGQEGALLVTSVAQDSPAHAAGVQTSDALLELDGVRLAVFEDLVAALSSRGGVKVALKLLRAGEVMTVEVEPDAREPRGRRRC